MGGGVTMRRREEIAAAELELFEKAWYDRHLALEESGERSGDLETLREARRAAEGIRRDYGEDALGPYTDFEWGMLLGRLSALRWVLGDDWDSVY